MKAPSTAAFAVIRYVVVAAGLEPVQYRYKADAKRAFKQIANRRAWSKLYYVKGEIVTDLWERPILLDEAYAEVRAPNELRAAS